jgi:protein TonB
MSYANPEHEFPKRLIGFAIVVLLHGALAYALVKSLGYHLVEVYQSPLEVSLVTGGRQGITPERVTPSLAPALAPLPLPVIPLPEVRIDASRESARAASVGKANGVPAQLGRHTPLRTAPVVDLTRCEKYPYPPEAKKAGRAGTVRLAVVIDVDGSVLQSKIERSSGSLDLDEAARRAMLYCTFRPATVDGVPERSRASVEYQWKIE